jgi:hypothetical protein
MTRAVSRSNAQGGSKAVLYVADAFAFMTKGNEWLAR